MERPIGGGQQKSGCHQPLLSVFGPAKNVVPEEDSN
jgi:hypothetical protein